jgi:NitT/TauT family transport system ATP-binding protein
MDLQSDHQRDPVSGNGCVRATAEERSGPFIAVCDVSLAYGEDAQSTLAVERLTLRMDRGEFVAVVGPSGCGKSTLMKLVSGLLLPTSGNILVRSMPVREPVAGIGMAFQNPLLMPWRTTLRNVVLPLDILGRRYFVDRRERAARTARAQMLLQSVGLAGFEQKLPYQLSGGMQQRANLCRAIIHQPEILLLDEPFGALDAFTREELWVAMQTLWLEQKFSAMLVTHDLTEAVFLADRIFVMSGRPGRIIEQMTVTFPRPRMNTLLADAAFTGLVSRLRTVVQDHGSLVPRPSVHLQSSATPVLATTADRAARPQEFAGRPPPRSR